MSNFWKAKTFWKVNFDISKLFIQCNIDNYCEHIPGSVNMYLYRCVSLLAWVYRFSLRLCVWYQISGLADKQHYASDISKLNALLHETHSKVIQVPRYHGPLCVNPYYPFNKRNRLTKRAVMLEVRVEWFGLNKIFKIGV